MNRLLVTFLSVCVMLSHVFSQINWIKHPDNPVMVPDQDWETRVIAPNAVIYDKGQYHMWYTAGEFPAGGDLFIGHAVSDDGLSWTKDEGNPVFANGDEGSWDSRGAYKVTVLKTDTTYHMWYTGYASSGSPKEIGHATSDDGIDWTRDPANPILSAGASGAWDYSRLANPTVVHDGSMFHMWYGGYNGDGSKVELGHATSADGSVWTKDPQNPVISSEVAGWDNPQLGYPFALYDGATFHIWYNAGDFLGWDIGYATSDDGTDWAKHDDPVLSKGETGSWDSRYLSMPVVLHDETVQKYKIWYRGESIANTKGGIGYAETITTPSSLKNIWYKHPSNPVFEGVSGQFDSEFVRYPSIVVNNNQYHMWYSGFNRSEEYRVGYAVSSDGITWERHPSPVLQTGSSDDWDSFSVEGASVLHKDSTWHMWYTGLDGPVESYYKIGYATSKDKINWTKYESNPVMETGGDGEWDRLSVGWMKVLFIDGIYHMWYTGRSGHNQIGFQIGHATSADGITWEKDPANPVLTVGTAGAWDDKELWNPDVYYDGFSFHMWFGGSRVTHDEWEIGYAVSLDGSSWQKISTAGPVLVVGNAGQWDSQFVGGGVAVIMEDDILKMWYGGGNSPDGDSGKIGYAQSDSIIINGLKDNLANKIPREPSLSQNYPNPFNPVTTIEYQLPIATDVTLSVYNTLGQKVAILVNKIQSAGNYKVQWNASAFASGVYFYILETSTGLKLSKKLVLLK